MKRFLSVFLFLVSLFVLLQPRSFAQSSTQSGSVDIKVTINGFLLSLSGYLAPYASITLTSSGNVFASAVADANGNFTFSGVKVAKGFSTFCLDGIDYKRLGESEACFTIPPVNSPYTKSAIFLPPTLGVFRTNVNVGNDALVFGYGMPGAHISIKLDGQVICQKDADSGGYYECNFPITKEGNHQVYADASLHNKQSEPQLKKVLIKGIALAKATPKPPYVPGISFGLPEILVALFILLLLIIVLIVLLRKFKPSWLPHVTLPNPGDMFHHQWDVLFRERKLHHWWMEGVGF